MASRAEDSAWRALAPAPPPLANPLRGFVPYQGEEDAFPHTLEYNYVGFADIVKGPDTFDFEAGLEPLLDDVASRGHQAIVRLYIDYPDEGLSVPKYLVDAGLKLRSYTDHGGGRSPDYAFEPLVVAMERAIAAFGVRYDGDPRLGYVQVGLLGHWGEWHTWPHEELFAPESTQRRVLAAYDHAFSRTPVLISQDAMGQAILPALGATRLGFHDDNFANGTLATDDWRFHARLLANGFDKRWQRHPVGGEVQPTIQESLFDVPSGAPEDFTACVAATRPTWLLYQEVFDNDWPEAKRTRALEASRLLGYALRVTEVRLDGKGAVGVRMVNVGAAPFPQAWPAIIEARTDEGATHTVARPAWDVRRVMPGGAVTEFTHTLDGPVSGTLYLRIPNRLANGPDVRFANADDTPHGLPLGGVP